MPSSAPPDVRLDTARPFTTAQAVAAGISAKRLRSRAFRRLAKGIYVSSNRRVDALLHAESALLRQPLDAFVSHSTAAEVYRLPVPHDPDLHVSVFTAGGRRTRAGVRCHVAPRETQVFELSGIRIAAPGHVFLQLAARATLLDLVVIGDAMVRKRWYTPDELVALCRTSRSRYAGRALTAARWVRAGVDSPMETRLRMLLVLAGLPEPAVNHELRDPDGRVRRRLDLCYPDVKVIVEYDGRQHAEDRAQYAKDRDRREELDDDGWRLLVVTAEGILVDPQRTLDRVTQVLRARGVTGLPTTYGLEWRRHFPGRPASSGTAAS